MMTFKTHPLFDNSERQEWFELPLSDTGLPSTSVSTDLASEIVRRDFTQIAALAIERITSSVPDDWLNECPHPVLNQMLFHPTANGGVKVFLEYMFLPKLNENSPHSDSWWAIAFCAYPNGNPYTGKIDYGIMHIGWASDWMD